MSKYPSLFQICVYQFPVIFSERRSISLGRAAAQTQLSTWNEEHRLLRVMELIVCTLNNHSLSVFDRVLWEDLSVFLSMPQAQAAPILEGTSPYSVYPSLLSPTWYQDIFGIGHSMKLPGTFWAYSETWSQLSPNAPKRGLINFSPSRNPCLVAFTAIM